MLDKQKVMQELERSIPPLLKESSDEYSTVRTLFTWLQQHPDAVELLKKTGTPYTIPSWEGLLDAVVPIAPHEHPYVVLAVDGSQIYPDKHQGVSCYLVNSGVVHFVYGTTSSVRLFSSPTVYTQLDDTNISEDMVNCRRAEHEFDFGWRESVKARAMHPEIPFISLCDGSLIFWHLESKGHQIKERFLKRYIEQLDRFYQERIPLAGYISLPKSKEVVALLRNAITHNLVAGVHGSCDMIVDADIMGFFLPQGYRSTLFMHNSALAARYPQHLRPCFLYLNIGNEIARVEVPAWVAEDEQLLMRVIRIIHDQCIKGNGYPIALSEAHEQAVVKAGDREFFFEMLYKMSVNHNHRMTHSQKSLKKRYVAV